MLAQFKFIVFFFFFLLLFRCRFGGSESLALALYVAFLGFFGLSEYFFYVFNFHKGPGKVVASLDGLKPRNFFGEAHGIM